jgi:hypothetical protein
MFAWRASLVGSRQGGRVFVAIAKKLNNGVANVYRVLRAA